ncbi:MAG: aspartate aminotransferase family protein [Deltaproteobacteria bacterium]|nr:aspartate aminotransferase family protein [Deltaproteobacteria bacterium]
MEARPTTFDLDRDHVFATYDRAPVVFIRGDGVWLFDADGKRYLDLLSGIAVNALGHNHPRVVAAISEQAGKVLHVSNLFHNEHQAALAERLCAATGMSRAFFCNSGAEAIEAAIKVARRRTFLANSGTLVGEGGRREIHSPGASGGIGGEVERSVPRHNARHEIVALEGSFHGRTLGALSVTGQAKYRDPFEPLIPGIRFVRPNDIEAISSAVGERTCAVIVEPILGEGGVRVLDHAFLGAAREACDKCGALLIFDEVQCGLGRTGAFLASQASGVRPDLVALAKPLGLGIPMGALLGSEATRDAFTAGTHGSTFGGGPLACRVSIEFLEIIGEERLLERVRTLGARFAGRLREIQARNPLVKEVRGAGLMLGMELSVSGRPIVKAMLERGFVINCAGENVLRFLPPYIIGEIELDSAAAALGDALSEQQDNRS